MTGIGNLPEKEMTKFSKFQMCSHKCKMFQKSQNSISIQMMQNTKNPQKNVYHKK